MNQSTRRGVCCCIKTELKDMNISNWKSRRLREDLDKILEIVDILEGEEHVLQILEGLKEVLCSISKDK